jgi:hypothetical protein
LSLIQLPAPILLLIIKLTNRKLSNYSDIELQDASASGTAPAKSDNLYAESSSSTADSSSQAFSFSMAYFKSMVNNKPVFQMTLLMSLLVFFFEGLQASHGGYIFSYTEKEYHISVSKLPRFHNDTKNRLILNRHHQESDDSFITATFWAFFSIGRLASIFIATKFSCAFMLSIDIVGSK